MNENIEDIIIKYNSIVKKIHKIKNEHRYEECQFKTAQSNMDICKKSLEQLISQINNIREKLGQKEKRIFLEFKEKYPNVEDDDIYSSTEYGEAKQQIEDDRILCDKFEKRIKEYINKYEEEIEKIKQEQNEFKEKQEKLKKDIKQKILGACAEYGDDIGIIQSIVMLNGRIVKEIYEAGTKAEFELSNELKVPYNFYEPNNFYGTAQNCEGGSSFKEADKCTLLKEKDALAKRKKRMTKLKQLLEENPETYNIKGKIPVKGLDIPFTQKELIEAGFIPEKFGWKPLEHIYEEKVKEDEKSETEGTVDNKKQKNIVAKGTYGTKETSFQMIEYKESAFSKFKNFLKRILG